MCSAYHSTQRAWFEKVCQCYNHNTYPYHITPSFRTQHWVGFCYSKVLKYIGLCSWYLPDLVVTFSWPSIIWIIIIPIIFCCAPSFSEWKTSIVGPSHYFLTIFSDFLRLWWRGGYRAFKLFFAWGDSLVSRIKDVKIRTRLTPRILVIVIMTIQLGRNYSCGVVEQMAEAEHWVFVEHNIS